MGIYVPRNQSEASVCMCLDIIISNCVAIDVSERGSMAASNSASSSPVVHSVINVIHSGAYTCISIR